MYSHDTYGLGHLTRTLRIARAIRERFPNAATLILSGSPVAPYMPLPPGADLVKLPSVQKSGANEYRARDLDVDFKRIKAMRREVIRSTAEAFRPDLFLVDNVPAGMKGEILPTLEMLRTECPETKIVLDLRDILDESELIRANWQEHGTYELFEKYYDRILVFGDPNVFDAVEAYGLPADRTVHVGYVSPNGHHVAPSGTTIESAALPNGTGSNGAKRPRKVLLTAGGGGDGYEFLSDALQGLCQLARTQISAPAESLLEVEVVTGPLMNEADRKSLSELAQSCGASLLEFVPDLPQRMAGADLVVAMAGYNTCCELLSHARAALLLPRVAPRLEQLIRARALEDRGLWKVLPPGRTSSLDIALAAAEILRDGPTITEENLPAMDGLARMTDELALLCSGLGGRPRGSELVTSIKRNKKTPARPPKRSGGETTASGIFSRATEVLRGPREAFMWYWPGAVAGART